MRSGRGVLALVFVVAACGGKVGSDAPQRTEAGGGTGGAAGAGGGAAGGSSGAEACPGGPVTVQIVPDPNAVTDWCLGTPAGCALGLELSDASGELRLDNYCDRDCGSCDLTDCLPIVCLAPVLLGPEGTTLTWDGVQFAQSTCGAPAETCARRDCAAPGRYTIEICGFPSPGLDPDSPCAGASAIPATCLTVEFTYPAPEPILVTLPDP
ncbi:MAG TPA: hypothetical protein PLU22_00665 [Polyangiaceae bacterium]|nr:hypothetical protein [Polyangiaceae bacterium]